MGQINAVASGESPWPLVLIGKPGTGKTCAALCMLDYAGGQYYTVASLCSLLIQSQQGRLEWSHEGRGGTLWPEQFWTRLAREPLVVLDELGCRAQVSDAQYEAVKNVIEERHARPLVVISNLAVSDLARVYDDRIASRLAAGTVFEVEGEDRRLSDQP